jgi:uncharacterized protein
MTFSPTFLDWLLVALLTSMIIVDHWLFAALGRRANPEAGTARVRYYAFVIGYEWALAVGVLALWVGYRRPWGVLLLGVPSGWRLAAGLVFAAAYFAFAAWQSRVLRERPEAVERLRHQVHALEDLLPHTPHERAVFRYLSVTAGICEEILFRGYLLALMSHFTGLAIAVPIAALLFGMAHTYQGPAGILKTGLAGLVLTFIALGSASLLPGILVHIGLDLSSGDLGYQFLSSTPQAASAPLPRAAPDGSGSESSAAQGGTRI